MSQRPELISMALPRWDIQAFLSPSLNFAVFLSLSDFNSLALPVSLSMSPISFLVFLSDSCFIALFFFSQFLSPHSRIYFICLSFLPSPVSFFLSFSLFLSNLVSFLLCASQVLSPVFYFLSVFLESLFLSFYYDASLYFYLIFNFLSISLSKILSLFLFRISLIFSLVS